jgi:hypothetical protein
MQLPTKGMVVVAIPGRLVAKIHGASMSMYNVTPSTLPSIPRSPAARLEFCP